MISDDGEDVLLAAARSDFQKYHASRPREPLLRLFHRNSKRHNIRVTELPEQCGLLTGKTIYWGVPISVNRDGKTLFFGSCSVNHYDLDFKTARFTGHPL